MIRVGKRILLKVFFTCVSIIVIFPVKFLYKMKACFEYCKNMIGQTGTKAQGMFYHYTSSDGARGIQKSGVIKQSLSRGSWPTGVYLTTMEPEKHSRTDILIKMHGVVRSDNQNRADWVVLIEGKTLDLNKLVAVPNTSDVYCYRDEIRVQPGQIIDKPKCQQGAANFQHNQLTTSHLNLVHETFYHYTSTAGARGIQSSGVIRESRQRGSWKSGVYLTKMRPEQHKREEILINIHGSVRQDIKNQADWVVVIDGRDLDNRKLVAVPHTNDVYSYHDEIRVRPGQVIDKPMCQQGSENFQHNQPSNLHLNSVQGTFYYPTSSSGARSIQSTGVTYDVYCNRDEMRVQTGQDVMLNSQLKQQSNAYSKMVENSLAKTVKISMRQEQLISFINKPDYQDNRVTIFAPRWVETPLQQLSDMILNGNNLNLKICDSDHKEQSIESGLNGCLTLNDLVILARNEQFNTNGRINFENYKTLIHDRAIVMSIKDLVRQTVIVGFNKSTHYGGYRMSRCPYIQPVLIVDLIGLQFQQDNNTGRLVLVGDRVPKGIFDDIIYENVVGEPKKSFLDCLNANSDRYRIDGDIAFDCRAYRRFVAYDFVLAVKSIEAVARKFKVHLKFLKYGTGYFAGKFQQLLNDLIGDGVADGFQKLIKNKQINGSTLNAIKTIELPYFTDNRRINNFARQLGVDCIFSQLDALDPSMVSNGCLLATTNCGDPHAMTGNKMEFTSIDGTIAKNLVDGACKFNPIINRAMRSDFIDI